jgi:hypothetical protein
MELDVFHQFVHQNNNKCNVSKRHVSYFSLHHKWILPLLRFQKGYNNCMEYLDIISAQVTLCGTVRYCHKKQDTEKTISLLKNILPHESGVTAFRKEWFGINPCQCMHLYLMYRVCTNWEVILVHKQQPTDELIVHERAAQMLTLTSITDIEITF